jgi:hypothetical protein
MKQPRFFLNLLLLSGLSSTAVAMDLHLEQERSKSFLTASAEFSQFTLEEGSIGGSGLKVDFNNSFTDKISLEIYLASAINTTGGSSFTGLGGYTYYNLYGDCCLSSRRVLLDGRPMMTETTNKGSNLQVGVGLDQFFLNGSKSVYSASGLGLSAIYQFALFKYNFKAEGRHSQMTAGENKIQGTFFSFGLVFAL